MTGTPRISLDEDFPQAMSCAICGQDTLKVNHVQNLPDFVGCDTCGSAFVVEEGGDRIMYGKIDDAYNQTKAIALRQWLSYEEIEQQASEEHPPTMPAEEPEVTFPIDLEPSPPSERIEEEPFAETPSAIEPEVSPPFEPIEEPLPPAIPSLELDEVEAAPSIEPEIPSPSEPIEDDFEDLETPIEVTPAFEPEIRSDLELPPEDLSEMVPPLEAPPLIEPEFPSQLEPEEELPDLDAILEERLDLETPELDRFDEPEREPFPEETIETPPVEEIAPEVETPEAPAVQILEHDPPPEQRFRVLIKGRNVTFPKDACAHCMRTPVKGQLAVVSTLPKADDISQRERATFTLPLCSDCHKRARVRSEEEKGARLQAHLISALVALVSLVIALALGVNPIEEGYVGLLILVILAAAGYTVPALILLNRLGPFPASSDAQYVRSTLLIPREVEGDETTFEWRNEAYANLFHAANTEVARGAVVKIEDRSLT
jgi:hypothetical protein